MNKIVREHYPVANLPEDLREGFDAGATVTVVVEGEEEASVDTDSLLALALAAKPVKPEDVMEMRRRLLSDGRPSVTIEEAVARIRELRDEWD